LVCGFFVISSWKEKARGRGKLFEKSFPLPLHPLTFQKLPIKGDGFGVEFV
jgi:hypothetical protein